MGDNGPQCFLSSSSGLLPQRVYSPVLSQTLHRAAFSAPTRVAPAWSQAKLDLYGLGYDPYKNFEDFRAIKQARLQEQESSGGGTRSRGNAFGVGVFEVRSNARVVCMYVCLCVRRGPRLQGGSWRGTWRGGCTASFWAHTRFR